MATSVGISMLIALASVQAVLYYYDSESAERIAARAVAQIEAIASNSQAAARLAANARDICSPDDIDKLKEITFRSAYLSDVGRVKNDQIVCTALWGVLAAPTRLPPANYRRKSLRIWHAEEVLGSRYHQTNLVLRDDLLTVSSPSAFNDIDPVRRSSIMVFSQDKKHVFKAIAARRMAGDFSESVIVRQLCSNTIEACAAVRLPRKSLWQLNAWLLGYLASGAAAAGSAVSILILRRRRAPRNLDERLASALSKGLITLEYQPLCDGVTGRVMGWEALSRWTTSSGEVISPDIFVPLAQIHGLSATLARYVVQRALSELRPRLEDRDYYVCVNVEPEDIADNDFPSYVEGVAARKGIRPAQLKFEVTERTDIVHPDFLKNMQLLQSRGFTFLIDDFGTGNANFSHLAKTRFDGIKIDRLFTSALATPSPLRSVLPAIYELAITLDLAVTVEGVESQVQLDAIRHIAPKATVQGWHLGRPSAAEALQQ